MSWVVWCRVLPEPRKTGGWWEQTAWEPVAELADKDKAERRAKLGTEHSAQYHTNLEYVSLEHGELP